ncbi:MULTISPECIES: hypothetical protein [Komagataeibacter]|uniref:hypothetical protein n=1 Tax=Komagataeibacter TaxID=1434011 RepID=UPI00137915F1|nr:MULTISPECIES: hypothetical protein [Komagataeibacter]MBV1825719.1 hypothetical protein [Komagataeibacter oboediens]WEQ50681.1 hypothetical protein LV478_00105 [Komagataeibacter oboediens]
MLKTDATDPPLANPLALRLDDNFGGWLEQRSGHQGAVIYPACLARGVFFRRIPV